MEKVVSCCGVVCSECEYYPDDCQGCHEIQGKVFWLHFTGGKICDIYNCCVNKKKLEHCGKCTLMPCVFYEHNDPTKSEEDNKEILKKQVEKLHSM